jgi:photosystem II stability/assembly factor-like uncharacterized protein
MWNKINATNYHYNYYLILNSKTKFQKMKTVQLLFLAMIVISLSQSKPIYAQSGWIPVNTGLNGQFLGVDFPGSSTGYAVGKTYANTKVIYKSTNAGNNWVDISVPLPGIWWWVDFVNDNTGYVAGSGGEIYKTTNGGANWVSQTTGINNVIFVLNFINENTGYAGAETGKILKTTNGGSNWVLQANLEEGRHIEGFYFFNASSGFACGREGTLLKTTTGGINWEPIDLGTHIWFVDVEFVNANTGFIVGGFFYSGQHLTIKTTDGGLNWNGLLQQGYYLTSVEFPSANTGYVSGLPGKILKTTNAGGNWISQQVNPTDTLDNLFFLNDNTGYMASTNGIIYKTTTGGAVTSNVTNLSGVIPGSYDLYQNFPNPFNPSTNIRFDIPLSSDVKLAVYDLLGREVSSLMNGQLSPGRYEYSFDGSGLPSGVYIYRLRSGNFNQTKKMFLMK